MQNWPLGARFDGCGVTRQASLRQDTFEHYVCPVCLGPLEQQTRNGALVVLACSRCPQDYPIKNGIPHLIPQQAYQDYPIHKVKDIYDRAYQHPDVMGTKFDPQYSRVTKTALLSLCNATRNPRILDIGTGDGDLWEFANPESVWHAIDLSEVGIRCALHRFPRLKAAVAVSEWLPYSDAYFDAITAVDTIEHAFDLPKTLACIRRVLAPGGTFAFSVPIPNSLRKWALNRIVRSKASPLLVLRLAWTVLKRTALFGHPCFQPIDRDLTLEGWRATLLESAGLQVFSVEQWPLKPLEPIVYLLAAKAER